MSFSLSASLLEISASDVSPTAYCSPFELQAVSIIAATAQIVKMIALDFINILLNKQNNIGTILPVIIPLYFLFVKRNRKYNSYIKQIGGTKMLVFDFRTIGNKLLSIRKKAGLTQSEVAEKANLSDRTYADIERGTVNMRIETVLKICEALHITPDMVLTTEDPDITAKQDEILNRLEQCTPSQKDTALKLLTVYLNSLSLSD